MNECSLLPIYKQKRKQWITLKETKTKQICHKDIHKLPITPNLNCPPFHGDRGTGCSVSETVHPLPEPVSPHQNG